MGNLFLGRQLSFSGSLITRGRGGSASSSAPNEPIPLVLLPGITICFLVLSCSWHFKMLPHCPGRPHLSRCAILYNMEEDGPRGILTTNPQPRTQQLQVSVFLPIAEAMQQLLYQDSGPHHPTRDDYLGIVPMSTSSSCSLASTTCLSTHTRGNVTAFQNSSLVMPCLCLGTKC